MRNVVREKQREVHYMHQDSEDTEVSIKEFDMVRSKFFNVHSIQSIIPNLKPKTSQRTELCEYKIDTGSVITPNLKTETSQRTELCEYKIDTGIIGNFIPIRMFKLIDSNTKIMDLNMSIDKSLILCTYKNSCKSEMGVCRVTIIKKGTKYCCSYHVVPGSGLALLGIPVCERLQLLSINCQTTNSEER